MRIASCLGITCPRKTLPILNGARLTQTHTRTNLANIMVNPKHRKLNKQSIHYIRLGVGLGQSSAIAIVIVTVIMIIIITIIITIIMIMIIMIVIQSCPSVASYVASEPGGGDGWSANTHGLSSHSTILSFQFIFLISILFFTIRGKFQDVQKLP